MLNPKSIKRRSNTRLGTEERILLERFALGTVSAYKLRSGFGKVAIFHDAAFTGF